MPEATANEFLTKRELAHLCRCSERTIDRLLEQGDAPPVTRLSTRRIVFPAASAREWLLNRTLGATRHLPQGIAVAATQVAPPQRRGRPSKAPAIEASE
jgi:predicted DNA-binding transcriptional regulator AlpA